MYNVQCTMYNVQCTMYKREGKRITKNEDKRENIDK